MESYHLLKMQIANICLLVFLLFYLLTGYVQCIDISSKIIKLSVDCSVWKKEEHFLIPYCFYTSCHVSKIFDEIFSSNYSYQIAVISLC